MRIWTIVWLALLLAGPVAARDFNRANNNEPGTLGPQKYELASENAILRDLFEGLTTQDADNHIVPGQAESWTSSGNGLTWTFKLREGLVWSDGEPVTAEDFVAGARRLADPATGAQIADPIRKIANGIDVLEGRKAPEALGVTAPDARTVVFTMAVRSPRVPALLAETVFVPVPRHAMATYGAEWVKPGKMVSNGAYVLSAWSPSDFVRLEKNPRFRAADTVRIPAIVFTPSDDQETALKRFRAGEIDMVPQIPPAKVAWAKTDLAEALRLTPVLQVRYIAVNHDRPMLQDVRVRRALALTLDRETIAGQLMLGTALPAYGLVPRAIEGYGGAEFDFKARTKAARIAEARGLMAAAGYGPSNPLKLELRTIADGWARPVAVAIQSMWKAIGVETMLKPEEARTHYAALKQGDYDLAISGWFGTDDPEEFMWLFQKGGGINESHYANDAFDAVRLDAEQTMEMGARYARYAQAEKLLLDDVACLPLFWTIQPTLVSPEVTGFAATPRGLTRSRYAGFGR